VLHGDVTCNDDIHEVHSDNNTSTTEQKATTKAAIPSNDCRSPVFSVYERQLHQQNSSSNSNSNSKQLQQSPDANAITGSNDVYDCPRTPSLPEWSLSNTTRAYLHKHDDIDKDNSVLNRSSAVPLMNIQKLIANTGVTVKSVTEGSSVLNDSTQHNRSDAVQRVGKTSTGNYSDESKSCHCFTMYTCNQFLTVACSFVAQLCVQSNNSLLVMRDCLSSLWCHTQ
jgi:hypothetical protein